MTQAATVAMDNNEEHALLPDNGGISAKTGEEEVHIDNKSFNEDLYEFAACALIRDAYLLSLGNAEEDRKLSHQRSRPLRCSRILFSLSLLWASIFVQAFLILEAKRLISARAVNNIRNVYSEYEAFMYNNHTHLTVNGFHRGDSEEFFVAANFESDFFDEVKKLNICQISLSQPSFLMTILFIWALICIGEIGNALRLFSNLVARLPTISTMKDAIVLDAEEDEEDVEAIASCNRIVVGLTLPFKIMMTIMIIVPQLTIACFLLWLGSRWLLATNDFGDVMLNAVALEFIFMLKDLFYRTVLSVRNKLDVERTVIKVNETNITSVWSMFSKALWIPIAAIWVAIYVYRLQAVLPEYRWDVHTVCETFISEITKA